MKTKSLKYKYDDIKCPYCVLNIMKTLSSVEGIKELRIDIDSKFVKVVFDGDKISKDEINDLIELSIM